jgi:hypothetical protein
MIRPATLGRSAAFLSLVGIAARPAAAQWDPDSLGHHRAVVEVRTSAPAVLARLPWRRRDRDPETRDLVVISAGTGRRVNNVAAIAIGREAGTLAFEPVDGPGRYDIYYLRYTGSVKSNYPRVRYPGPSTTPDSAWVQRAGLGSDAGALPEARFIRFEDSDQWNAVEPMEVIATEAETRALVAQFPTLPMLLFPEDRAHSIRMTADLPRRWIESGANGPVTGEALKGEFFAFQVGVFALEPLDSLTVELTDLRARAGAVIPRQAIRCISLGGVDWEGKPFQRRADVAAGTVQPLWFGIDVPLHAFPGLYQGELRVWARGLASVTVPVRLTVKDSTISAHGDDEPARLSRLRWLDSRLYQDDSLVRPYTAIRLTGTTLGILGREVRLAPSGFPASIVSHFTPEMTGLRATGQELLAAPIELVAETGAGEPIGWRHSGVRFTHQGPGSVRWRATSRGGSLLLVTQATLEMDGNIEYVVKVRATRAAEFRDIRLELPFRAAATPLMMGLGQKGGPRPAPFEWRWYEAVNQDAAWVGGVNAGLQFTLKDERYVRPLNTNFYQLKPLVMPTSWFNDGRGGCRFTLEGDRYVVRCFSGQRTMAAGDSLFYNVRLLITPFHPVDPARQFRTRFYHAYQPLDSIAAAGANVINVHHATPINPWINYPFLTPDTMRAYIRAAHARGMRVKLYYTVRELTTRAPELWALRSLGHEVFAPGAGGGYAWLQEHLGDDYIAAWYVPELKDAAIVTSGVSRWHNFYVEGLDWLARNTGMDGVYIDDVAFDRTTMKRVRKALDRHRPDALIDLHSANQYNPNDGWASSANLYLEHFPYLDRLWFGEYFDYDSPPEYWLVEMSGIPFGLMGEMLEGGGNPWRGMLFGMTSRLPWAGDPRPLWRVWDDFGIEQARMAGWWSPAAPVRTDRSDVLATSYVRPGRTLVSIASWAPDTTTVVLSVDWKRLGIDASTAEIVAPEIRDFQPAARFAVGQAISVPPGKGWLLEVRGEK